jgi:hypothetical protein
MKEILLFNRCLNVAEIDFKTVNEVAINKGYLIDPNCCNSRVLKYLQSLPNNLNTTFYKSWNDVTCKTREELWIDQLKHYASTYGTEFKGEVYLPNKDSVLIDYTDVKVIKPISIGEIGFKIQALLNSGIAMNQETLDSCMELVREFNIKLDLNTIRNKEVLMYLYKELDLLPESEEEMVRFLVYLYTGKTLLIKSPDVIAIIKNSRLIITPLLERFGLEKLSSVFLRFKPLFLAMKDGNEKTINTLRRLAVANHKPKVFGFWANVLSNIGSIPYIEKNLPTLNNFKLIALLQTILVRKQETGIMTVIIKNGKVFTGEKSSNNKNYYDLVYDLLYKELITRLGKKACTVKLPTIQLAMPTSEKTYVGNIPFGSKVTLSNNAIVGINWKGVDGANDLDLSIIDNRGDKIGWNSSYKNDDESVVYSGDVTSANPEATELLYCKAGMPNSVVKVNCYSGEPNSKYTLFFGQSDNISLNENEMINPNDVIFSTELSITGESTSGIFIDKSFYFMNLNSGKGAISFSSKHEQNFIKQKEQTVECYLYVEKVLKDARFTIVEKEPQLDLSVNDKSLLIELLSDGI